MIEKGSMSSEGEKVENITILKTRRLICERVLHKNFLEIFIKLTMVISIVCFLIDFLAIQIYKNNIELTNDTVIQSIMLRLPEYTDVFLAVYVAIIAALLTITITMYVFLKSTLDRLIDENQYNANVAAIYQERSSNKLFKIASFNIVPIIISVFWHLILQFQNIHIYMSVFIGLPAGLLCLLLVILATYSFWTECIKVRIQLRTIRLEEVQECLKEIRIDIGNEEPKSSDKRDKILLLIGYWTEWNTDDCDNKIVEIAKEEVVGFFERLDKARREDMIKIGKNLCKELAVDQYINLFSRIEDLMLAGGQQSEDGRVNENDIVTIIQDRNSILAPIIGKNACVEGKDLEEKFYEMNHIDRGKVNTYIQAFRQEVGYDNDSDNNTEFYQSTEHLYKVLRRYRNLIISDRIDNSKHKLKTNSDGTVETRVDKKADLEMAIGLYYFLLRVMAVFVGLSSKVCKFF